jgi:glycosyltransferase involved in cell wall biosynthesis
VRLWKFGAWLRHLNLPEYPLHLVVSAMKILSIIEATTVTGPAKNLLNFCRLLGSPEFCRDGVPQIEVSIVTFERDAGNGGTVAPNAFVTAAREQGVTLDVIRERFRFDTRALSQLHEIVQRRQPDIIQTHMIKSHFLIKLSGLGKKYPWMAYHHGYTTTDLKMQFYNRLNRWSLPSANLVIAVCGAFAKQLTRSGVQEDRIRVSHNSVKAPRIISSDEQQTLRGGLGVAGDEKVMLAVGRLSREKGHADLIESIALLRMAEPDLKFKLLIVGDGPEQANLTQAVSERNLESHVVFVGHVTDVAPFYAIADLLALPSHSEGSPNVLLEAMAAGLPIVAASVGGVPEIATNEGDALLVAARDPSAFAVALRRALTEPELAWKLQNNAIARARDFSPESHARSLIEIYQELLSVTQAEASGSDAQRYRHDAVTIIPGSDTV